MIELVVLDMAGTTVEDPDGVGSAFKGALTAAGISWSHEQVNGIMGTPKPLAIGQLLGEQNTPQRVEPIFRDFQRRMIDYYRTDPHVKAIDGAEEFFRACKAGGIKIALDTGFDRSIVEVLFERLGWGPDLLDASVTSDEVANGRPKPDMIFRAMDLTGVTDPKRVAKVGDTPSDLGEGSAAGCALNIGVTYGTHTREQLAVHPHTHLVDSINEVLRLVSAR